MTLVVKYHLIIKSAHEIFLLLDNENCFLGQEGLGFAPIGRRVNTHCA